MGYVYVLVGVMSATLTVVYIGLRELFSGTSARAKPATAGSEGSGVLGGTAMLLFLLSTKVPCLSVPWLVKNTVLALSIGVPLALAGAVGITLLGSASGSLRRLLYGIAGVLLVVGGLGIVAGSLGGIATAVVGGGCQFAAHEPRLESGADQNAARRGTSDTALGAIGSVILRPTIDMAFAVDDVAKILREETPAKAGRIFTILAGRVDKLSRSVSLSGAIAALGFVALLVLTTRWGFDHWSARATWRRWLRIPLVGVAGIGMLPFCFSIVAIYVAQVVTPASMAGAWIAGMGLGVLMTVWLLFAPAPRAQAEVTAPQS
jgi:hypothetical protein